MRVVTQVLATSTLVVAALHATAAAQSTGTRPLPPISATPVPAVTTLASRLDLERYKATVKGLTQFGDRRQGTDRNRSGGRLDRGAAARAMAARPNGSSTSTTRRPTTGQRPRPRQLPSPRGRRRTPARRANADRRQHRSDEAAGREAARAQHASRRRPARARRSSAPRSARRHPNEMYIVGGHMDGHGWGEAANDDGSGTALVMELARIFSMPDVQTERTIRFALWNNEETGLNGARRLCRAAAGAAGQRGPAGFREIPRTDLARHDPARHDDVRPRHAAAGRDDAARSSGRKPT